MPGITRNKLITLRPGFCLALALFLLIAPSAVGGEDDAYVELMRRYERVNDEMLKILSEADPGYSAEFPPDRLLSVRKNAQVTIGGEARTTYSFTNGNWQDPGFDSSYPNKNRADSRIGEFDLSTAKLLIDARAGDRWRVFFDLDLNGYPGNRRVWRAVNVYDGVAGHPNYRYDEEHNLINQAYVELIKDGHSGFGFMVGKMKLPFGLWTRPNLYTKSFMDAPNLTGSYLANPESRDDGMYLPHASRFVDPALAALVSYEMRDIIRFDAALFQESESKRLRFNRNGTTEYRSEYVLPRSWQLGFSILPLEGWELSAHFRNRYSKSRGVNAWTNSPNRWDFSQRLASGSCDPTWDPIAGQWANGGGGESFGSRSNEQAFIVGLAVEVPNTNLAVQAEYAHGWNQGFNKYINSDGVNVGLSYKLTPFLTLHAQGEWLHIKDRSWMAQTGAGWRRDTRNNHLYRAMVGAEYELARGVTLEGGWQYEYWKINSSLSGTGGSHAERLNTANMFYLGTRFIF